MPRLDKFTRAYFDTALWSTPDGSNDEGGEPMLDNYTIDDFAPDTMKRMIADCADFQERFADQLSAAGIDDEQAGQWFWLSRNGHGSGFFDDGHDELQKVAKEYGEFDLYVGDDGLIYSPGFEGHAPLSAREAPRHIRKHRRDEQKHGSFVVVISDGTQQRFNEMRSAHDWAIQRLHSLPTGSTALFYRAQIAPGRSDTGMPWTEPFDALEKNEFGRIVKGRIPQKSAGPFMHEGEPRKQKWQWQFIGYFAHTDHPHVFFVSPNRRETDAAASSISSFLSGADVQLWPEHEIGMFRAKWYDKYSETFKEADVKISRAKRYDEVDESHHGGGALEEAYGTNEARQQSGSHPHPIEPYVGATVEFPTSDGGAIYGIVTRFEDGHAMVRWTDSGTITGVPPSLLRVVPSEWGGSPVRESSSVTEAGERSVYISQSQNLAALIDNVYGEITSSEAKGLMRAIDDAEREGEDPRRAAIGYLRQIGVTVHTRAEEHAVADFDNIEALIEHSRGEGATHVGGKRIYFPNGDGRWQEALAFNREGYWHLPAPEYRPIVSQLPGDAEPIESFKFYQQPGRRKQGEALRKSGAARRDPKWIREGMREPWQPGGTRIMMAGPDPTSDYALVQRMIGFYVTQKGLGDYVKGSAVPMGGGVWKFHTRAISVSKTRGRSVSREEEVSHAELSRMWQSKGVSEARRRKPVPVNMTQFASGFLDQLAADLSRELGGSKPEVIPGGFRWSEPNASAQFTTYSPEHNQKVVVVVSVFHENVGTEKRPVPKTAISIFSDEGLSEIDTYENIAHFNYAGADLRDMKKDVKWVWETVNGYAASWQDQDEGMEEKKKPRKRKPAKKKAKRGRR